jgi:hypothetical protein
MAVYAHLALQNHDILPSEFLRIPIRERASIVASDMVAGETMKRQIPQG